MNCPGYGVNWTGFFRTFRPLMCQLIFIVPPFPGLFPFRLPGQDAERVLSQTRKRQIRSSTPSFCSRRTLAEKRQKVTATGYFLARLPVRARNRFCSMPPHRIERNVSQCFKLVWPRKPIILIIFCYSALRCSKVLKSFGSLIKSERIYILKIMNEIYNVLQSYLFSMMYTLLT